MAESARKNKYFKIVIIISGIVLFLTVFVYLGIIKKEKNEAEYINMNLELSRIKLLMTNQEIEELNIGKLVDLPNTGGKIKEIEEKAIKLGFGELGKYKDKLTYLEIGNKEYSIFNGKVGDTKVEIMNKLKNTKFKESKRTNTEDIAFTYRNIFITFQMDQDRVKNIVISIIDNKLKNINF
jgi:type II secretory pathway pseudopilin PulG